jgi:protein-S-isoprenylcysteine O-methyltransferase Ste14
MWKLVIFAVASALITAASWRSLRKPATHGVPRFLAWEAITGLVLLNVEHWFADPWAPVQLLSWALLVGSLPLVGSGLFLLRTKGRPSEEGAQPTNYAWENTSQLIDVGIFRYVRHPMYASLLLLTWGVFLKNVSLAGFLLSVTASTCLVATAHVEEREDMMRFGEAYSAYRRRTRRFIPFVY